MAAHAVGAEEQTDPIWRTFNALTGTPLARLRHKALRPYYLIYLANLFATLPAHLYP
ncbi:hypothetical protein IGS59_00080 [Janthinobacterium sp. GW460P]|uniref:hypothetical protein n=1 Tax=unclassified Janthinobacterium TaxID=2610881 RepID=UPI001482DB18|nr:MULTISPECIES: hypothetical protein [unclassified Janthinobacterium]MCC7700619.1 hypothetical protein [Janthinobacterium sp. GW460P]MCC7706126.1 hypothetical protein [Janthinobacterium sp. GW460W]